MQLIVFFSVSLKRTFSLFL